MSEEQQQRGYFGVCPVAAVGAGETAQFEVLAITAGTGNGWRWMLAEVTPGRVLRVYPSPPEEQVEVIIDPDGSLRSTRGSRLLRANQALGRWARYQAWPDAPPVLVQGCALAGGRLVITAAPGRGWPR